MSDLLSETPQALSEAWSTLLVEAASFEPTHAEAFSVTFPSAVSAQALEAASHAAPDVALTFDADSPTEVSLSPIASETTGERFSAVAGLLCALQYANAVSDKVAAAPSEEQLDWCVSQLARAQAPYYARYVMVRNLFQDEQRFAAYLPRLQGPDMVMNPGHTQQHRFTAIQKVLTGGQALVDVGCGKATYLVPLAGRYKRVTGFEADMPTRGEAKHRLKRAGLDHVRVFGAFDSEKFVPDGSHVLMTEVLEHMPQDIATELVAHLAGQRAALMVFTVPNRLFNAHYGMKEGSFRHWDHHWEPTGEEFAAFMRKLLPEGQWTLKFQGIGDSVQGVHSGEMCLATRAVRKAVAGDWMDDLLSRPTRKPGDDLRATA